MTETKTEYPREDKCRRCGKHIGTVMSELGEAFANGPCDGCYDIENPDDDEDEEGEDDDNE